MKNSAELDKLRKSWRTVCHIRGLVETNLASASLGVIGGGVSGEFRDLSHNLVVLFAFSVLQDTLEQLAHEEVFAEKRGLKGLMESSKKALPWVDYDKVDTGRDKRNDIAHERIFLPRLECWEYIDAIEKELIAWEVLDGTV